MSLVDKAVTGVKWSSFATGVNVLLSTVTLMVLSRLIAPGDFGLLGMATVVTGFINTFRDFGLTDSVVFSQDISLEKLSSLYWFNMVFSWACCLAAWLITPLAVVYFNEPRVASIIRWSGVYFLIVPIAQQFNGLLRRELRFKTRSLVQIISYVIYTGLAISFAFFGLGVMSIVWAQLVQGIISSGILLYIAARSNWLPSFRLRPSEIKGFVKFGFYYTLQKAVGYFSKNIDYLLIGRFLGAEALGYYTLAYNLVRVPASYLGPLINSVAFPSFARLQNQIDLMRKGYLEILRYLSALLIPALGGLFVVAPVFVPVFYGAKWITAVPVVQIFCLLGFVMSMIDSTDNLLLAKGRTDIGFGLGLFSILGYALCNWIGLRWGIIGVAVSSTAFVTLILWPVDFLIRGYLTQMRLFDYWKVIYKRLTAGICMIFVTLLMGSGLTKLPLFTTLAIQVALGGVTYVVLLFFLDRQFFVDIRQRFFRRPANT
jgi:O-antigen/teichoic acid export membrane protein